MAATITEYPLAATGQDTGERHGNLPKRLAQPRDHSEEIRLLQATALLEWERKAEEIA